MEDSFAHFSHSSFMLIMNGTEKEKNLISKRCLRLKKKFSLRGKLIKWLIY